MSPIDAVCFDLDSTLCVGEQSDGEIYDAIFERVDVEPFFSIADVRGVDGADLPTAHSDLEFYEYLYEAVIDEVGGDPAHASALAEATVEVIDPAAVSFRDGAREALEHARERFEVGLITNGAAETQRAKLDRLGIADAFDVTVYCDPATGLDPKPDPAPFQRAIAELDAEPAATAHVGDSHGADVVGARGVGLRAVWTPPDRDHRSVPADPDPAPDHTLDSMADLPTVL